MTDPIPREYIIHKDVVEAFNGLGKILDVLHVTDLVLANDKPTRSDAALATILHHASDIAEHARAAAGRAADAILAEARHG